MYELGYARKNRSPNLYERYTWSTAGMVMIMNNTAGDGNGYVGDIGLEPETAHTISFSADWHGTADRDWALRVTPYFTYVFDYIDAQRCRSINMMSCGTANQVATNTFVFLQYANDDARLLGVDVSGSLPLLRDTRLGDLRLDGQLGYVDGDNAETGTWEEMDVTAGPTNYQRFASAVDHGMAQEPNFRHATNLQRVLDLAIVSDAEHHEMATREAWA